MSLSKKVSSTHLFKIIYYIGLVVLVHVGYMLAFAIQQGLGFLKDPGKNFSAYVALIPFISITAFLLADLVQLPRFYRKKNIDVVSQVINFAIIQTLLTTAAAYFINFFSFPRSVLGISMVMIFILLVIWSGICLTLSRRLYATGKLVIIGSSEEEMNEVERQIGSSLREFDLKLTDHVIYDDSFTIRSIIRDYSEVLICSSVPDNKKSEIILYCAKKNTVAYLIPQFYEIALYKSKLINFNDLMVFMLDRLRLTFDQRLIKRLFDIAISILALVLSLPFTLISALLIKLTSPGPVIYKQERVTIDNMPYHIYKLRTMRTDAEHKTGPIISGKSDPRVTKIGKFLRRSKLDEIPQFVNVLKGDMSVVGPRPERPVFVEQFAKSIPSYDQRFSVKAGITGLAQIAGRYDTSAEDKLRYDLLYIKNYSILQDIKIIFQTVRAILTPKLYKKTFDGHQDS